MATEILDTLKSRGYWRVLARPTVFLEERIESLAELQHIISQYQVRHRGWYFPHLNPQELKRKLDHIESYTHFMSIFEYWRYYQSSQFVFLRALTEDWLEEQGARGNYGVQPMTVLAVTSPLYFLSEVYEFCARLAQADLLGNELEIKINLIGVDGRLLWSWPGEGRHLSMDYRCDINELPKELTIDVDELVVRHAELSYLHFEWMMERFNFEPARPVFKRDQEKFFEGIY